ncbi:hypothetical protein GALMADRAFT_452512 [Galerina marginata CBS 339.88]|uniref:Uncharacterized protein n=1 Tax=Galerina marginata (strain CBS 339.88) TaxID=685588 RepID=A0A067T2S2_GALM3|nr:hypothetical protein GALMADRAFT_452512 [Galerina marginata CBS 339.88]
MVLSSKGYFYPYRWMIRSGERRRVFVDEAQYKCFGFFWLFLVALLMRFCCLLDLGDDSGGLRCSYLSFRCINKHSGMPTVTPSGVDV